MSKIGVSNGGMASVNVQITESVTLDSRIIASSYGSGHAHPAYQVGILEGGRSRAFYRGLHQTSADELIVFDSGEPHGGYVIGHEGWLRRTFLDIEPCALQRIGCAVTGRSVPAFHFPALGVADLFAPFASLFADLRQGVPKLEAEARTVDALLLLLERHADVRLRPRPIGQEPKAVREVRAYLEANLAENVSLEVLGEVTQMNWDYLRKAFRAHIGVPPHRYQVLLRLGRAKRLITNGAPLAQTAVAVGFADQAHLTRAFRRHLEMTPGSLRHKPSVQNVQDLGR